MKNTTLLILLSLSLFIGCLSWGYQIVDSYDEYDKVREIFQKDNWVKRTETSSYHYLDLNLYQIIYDSKSSPLYLKFGLFQPDWLFIKENKSIQILFVDGDVLTLNTFGEVKREVIESGIKEFGLIEIDKDTLNKMLNNKIKSIRVNGDTYYSEFKGNIDICQNRWVEYSDKYLNNFLNE